MKLKQLPYLFVRWPVLLVLAPVSMALLGLGTSLLYQHNAWGWTAWSAGVLGVCLVIALKP